MLHLSKEIVNKRSLDYFDYGYQRFVYSIIHNGSLLGQLFIFNKCALIRYNDKSLFIKNKDRSIKELGTNLEIGYYEYSNWTVLIGYRDKMFFNDKLYSFKKIEPDIRHSLFNKKTRGQFKFELRCDSEIITYSFKIEMPGFSLGNIYPERSFLGIIHSSNSDVLTILAGLYLIERALENQGE